MVATSVQSVIKNKGTRERNIKESLSIGFTSKLRRNDKSRTAYKNAARERSRLINEGKYNELEEVRICEKYSLHLFC